METNNSSAKATSPALIAVGSTKFARNEKALVATLFNASGTASGLFRVRKNGVLFMSPDRSPFAFLVANPNQSQFFVSASRQSDGRTRYSFGLSTVDAVRLGVSGMKYSEQSNEAERVFAEASAL